MEKVPDGYEPITDDDGKPTGYYREIATGEIVTLDDEWDRAEDEAENMEQETPMQTGQ